MEADFQKALVEAEAQVEVLEPQQVKELVQVPLLEVESAHSVQMEKE